MKRMHLVLGIGLGIALVSIATACTRTSNSAMSATGAAASLTRGGVIKIVREEIRREFALRDWHHYAGYIGEYTGADVASLFSLSMLDRATAVGDMNAPVRVIVYSDYECPYCKAFETTTAPVLRRKFRSQALFMYRFYPLEMHGKVAQAEAIAGACVARIAGPDAFRRYTGTVFAQTGSNGKGTKEPLATIAKTAMRGKHAVSDPDALDAYYGKCTQSKTGAALIAADAAFKGVTGTPTIFIVNTARHKAWRLAGAMPAWAFEVLITNVIAGRPGDSDWAVERHGASFPGLE
ncbi:MAG: DsbA family protein [Gammaproteobacteria bacterium]